MRYVDVMNITLQQMQILIKVIELRSFTKVANIYNFTPSMISKTVSSIEDEFGLVLFIRKHHELMPTPAAKLLACEWENIVSDVEKSIEKAHILQTGKNNIIRIGFVDSSEYIDSLIFSKIEKFKSDNVLSDVQIEKRDMHELVECLHDRQFDMIITARHEHTSLDEYSIPWKQLYESNLAIYVHKSNELYHHEKIDFSNLKNQRFIVLSQKNHYVLLEKKCMEYGYKPQIEMSVSNVRSMLYNLKLGKGIVFADALMNDWEDDSVKKFELFGEKAGLIVAWDSKNANPVIQKVIEYLM